MAPFDFQRYLGLTDEELARLPRYDPRHPRIVPFFASLLWLKRRRVLRECVRIVLGLTAMVTAFVAILAVLEPWNHSLFLWPTLTGTWVGEFAAAGGRKQLLLLQIDGDTETRSLGGTATTCDERGGTREFNLSGHPRGWRGKTFRLETAATGQGDGSSGLDGAYDGDTMRLDSPLVHLTLRRSGKTGFTTSCGRIRATP